MYRFFVFLSLMSSMLFCVPDGMCFTDVAKLDYEGFRLGMSFEEAVSNFRTKGCRENGQKKSLKSKEYLLHSDFKNDIPLHLITAKESDDSKFNLQFGNGKMLCLFWEKNSGESRVPVLINKYLQLFGKQDSGGEAHSGNEMTVYLVWGGEADGPYFDPMFISVKVEIACSKGEGKHNCAKTSEKVMMADFPKMLGLQYSESLKQYKEAILHFESEKGK